MPRVGRPFPSALGAGFERTQNSIRRARDPRTFSSQGAVNPVEKNRAHNQRNAERRNSIINAIRGQGGAD